MSLSPFTVKRAQINGRSSKSSVANIAKDSVANVVKDTVARGDVLNFGKHGRKPWGTFYLPCTLGLVQTYCLIPGVQPMASDHATCPGQCEKHFT